MTTAGDKRNKSGGTGAESVAARTAVSLEYDGINAPRVTASGEAEIADQILQIANDHDVPIYRDESLAKVLAKLELQDEIPASLYVAIAEILAFTYQLQDLLWIEET